MKPSLSFETNSVKECVVTSVATTAIVVTFWVVATSRVMTTTMWFALAAATSAHAVFVARRFWLISHQRGLEWSRADTLMRGAWQTAMLAVFWLVFFGELHTRS